MKKQSGKKLVEILAVELKEWPEGFDDVGQADRGSLHLPGIGDHVKHTSERYTQACDWMNAIVTREMWEAERAKLEGEKVLRACVEKCEPESKPKANAQGWVRNRGLKNPFDVCTLVDARLRSGEVVAGKFSENLHWIHTGNNFDVMAYRVNESVDSETPEVTAPVDGPLQWRDRVTEIDRAVEALEEERASLIQKLADEGVKLIKREAVELPDMSDWRNWREGDIVRCVSHTRGWSEKAKIGEEYLLKENPDPEADSGLHIYAAGYYMSPVDFKFVSRPTK